MSAMQSILGVTLTYGGLGLICSIIGDVLRRPVLGIALLAVVCLVAILVTCQRVLFLDADLMWSAEFLVVSTYGATMGFLGGGVLMFRLRET
jgi:hypothetical protein